MKIFNSIEHFFSWVLDKLIPKAETVAQDVEAVVGSSAAQALLELAGKSAWGPKFVAVTGSIVADLAKAAKDGMDFEAAVAARGLNLVLDEQALADLKAIFDAVKSVFGGKTVTVTMSKTVTVPK